MAGDDTADVEFSPFRKKGNRLVTTRTASVTMNSHGHLNIPGSVRTTVFNGAKWIMYHADHDRELLAIEAFGDIENAPQNAYKLTPEDPEESGTVTVNNVLAWMGKEVPDEHTMFELMERGGMACIDVSKLNDRGGGV
jgi:hypothetical protein